MTEQRGPLELMEKATEKIRPSLSVVHSMCSKPKRQRQEKKAQKKPRNGQKRRKRNLRQRIYRTCKGSSRDRDGNRNR